MAHHRVPEDSDLNGRITVLPGFVHHKCLSRKNVTQERDLSGDPSKFEFNLLRKKPQKNFDLSKAICVQYQNSRFDPTKNEIKPSNKHSVNKTGRTVLRNKSRLDRLTTGKKRLVDTKNLGRHFTTA